LVIIRKRVFSDNHMLLALWKRSVTATHTFLTEKDIQNIEAEVDKYLPRLEVWVCASGHGFPLGFIGLNRQKAEMLFVDPAHHGRGIGSRLLDHARHLYGRLSIDVNERNRPAAAFYRGYGFQETGRSETDAAGRPFPLLHMILKE
jgi:putative acetyltransferase